MTAEQFAYWLQGFAELQPDAPSAQQWQAIRDHLALVFNKVTPIRQMQGFPPGYPMAGGIAVVSDGQTRTYC